MSNQPSKRSNPTPRDFVGDKNKRLSHDVKQSTNTTMGDDSDDDGFEYRDDEFSDDEEVIIAGDDDDDDDDENDGNTMGDTTAQSTAMNEGEDQPRVWRHGIDQLQDGEVLEHAPEAYKVYETAQLEWPALSFDILKDATVGDYSTTYPVKIYAVTGTQTDKSHENKINVMMMENICESKDQDDDDGGFDLDGNDDDTNDSNLEPTVVQQSFLHPGVVNRIRAMPQNQSIISTFSENGSVYLWNITPQLSYLNQQLLAPPSIDQRPLYSFHHGCEGYGLAWSPLKPSLASADRKGDIYIHSLNPDGTSITTKSHSTGLKNGNIDNCWIEDIQWSPYDANVFATVDTSGHLSIWHERNPKPKILIKAHDAEINALSWNHQTQHLLATGDDDGLIKIWDLRRLKKDEPVEQIQAPPKVETPQTLAEKALQGMYNFHKNAITSLNWHPHESSTLVVGSHDDSITIWDLSLEADAEEEKKETTGAGMGDYTVPDQLLFQHLGQKEIKEVKFHPQYPSLVLSSASIGIDIFRPSNLDLILANPNQQLSEQIPVD